MTPREHAVVLFESGFSCSQAVLAAYAEQLGLDQKMALRISCGFGGGMGKQGYTCGAVTGAVMAIGIQYGRSTLEDAAAKDKTYCLVQEFFRRFEALHHTTVCRELIGCNMMTPEGAASAKERNVSKNICQKLVGDAADIVEEILKD